MSKTPLSEAAEIKGIEAALDTLLTAAIEADQRRPAATIDLADAIYSIADLDAWMQRPKAARDAEHIIENPIGQACRSAIRKLGKRLYQIGGCALMGEVCQRVADLDQRRWDYRTDILDKRWDMIGETDPATSRFDGWVA